MNEEPELSSLEALNTRMSRVEGIVETLQSGFTSASRPAFGVPPPPPSPYIKMAQRPQSAQVPESSVPSDDVIGRRVLPIVGAILLLCALGYWAPVAYKSLSNIGAFLLELGVSILFFVAGRIMRNVRGQFGEVVSGIGAGGLLVTIMAGSQYHHLYSGETMVALSLTASVAVAITGTVLRSRTFQAIGVVGGMISAWMPSTRHDLYLSAALQAIIVTATLVMFAQSKWRSGIAAFWPVALIASFPFIFEGTADWRLRLVDFYFIGLQFAAAYAYCYEKSDADPQAAFSGLALLVALIGGQCLMAGKYSGPYVAVYCAILASVGFAFNRHSKQRSVFQTAAASGAALLIPLGWGFYRAPVFCSSVSIALAGVAFFWKDVRSAWLSYAAVLMGCAVFVIGYSRIGLSPIFHSQSILWGGGASLIAAACLSALAVHNNSKSGILAFCSTAALGWLTSTVMGAEAYSLLKPDLLVSSFWAGWSLIILASGFKLNLYPLRICGYLLLAVTLLKVVIGDLEALEAAYKAAILACLGIVMLIGGYIAVRSRTPEERTDATA